MSGRIATGCAHACIRRGDGLSAGLASSTTGRPSTETVEAQDAGMRQADAIIIDVRQRMYFSHEFGAFRFGLRQCGLAHSGLSCDGVELLQAAR